MSRRPVFATIPEEEAEQRARQDTSAADQVAANLARKPGQTQGKPAALPVVEPAQSPQVAANDSDIRPWPVNKILVHKYNARRLPLNGAALDKLTKSLLVEQRTPVPAYIDENGFAVAIDGRRRLDAAKNGDIPELWVKIIPKPASDREIYKLSRAYNVEREQQSPLDDALSWKLLLEQGVYAEQKDIAADTGLDEAEVSRIIKLTELPPRILELLNGQEELLNLRMLNAIRQYCEVCGEEDTKALIISAESGELSSREVDKLRRARERTPVKRRRSNNTRSFTFVQGKAQVRQFDSARKVMLELEEVAEGVSLSDVTEALNATLKNLLGGEAKSD